MKLNESFRIEKLGFGFRLIEKYMGSDKKGNPKEQENITYHGTLYQALQAFLVKASAEDLDLYDIGLNISSTLASLEEAKEQIKAEFRTEVRVLK